MVSRSRIRSIRSSPSGSTRWREKKWACISDIPSQFADADSWQARYRGNAPADPVARAAGILNGVKQRNADVANQYRSLLVKLYGAQKGNAVKYAEAFELNQYGSSATVDELKQMFNIR